MSVISKLFTPEAHGKFELPIGTYYVARTVRFLKRWFIWLSALETRRMRRRYEQTEIDRPIWITGMARAGTTITLEIFSQHPDVGHHRYYHIPNPYIPHWWARIIDILPLASDAPVERIHKDGIMVTKDSPEALEEPLWSAFFKGLHDENRSGVLDGSFSHPKFERYFRDHIWKLLASQSKSRYLAKSNYSVTRMEYLLRLFPEARFLLIIRNPVDHLASYIKQNRLFQELEKTSRRMVKATKLIDHHEFGDGKHLINTGDAEVLQRIRQMWADGEEVRGFSTYWKSIYDHVADRLEANGELQKRVLVVRYEDLCARSEQTLDGIVEHTGLSAEGFAPIKAEYSEKLKPPTYYKAGFDERDLEIISEVAGPTSARFGYEQNSNGIFVVPEKDC